MTGSSTFRLSRCFRGGALLLVAVALAPWAAAADRPADDELEARKILVRWLDAMGGSWRIERLKTMDYTALFDFGGGRAPMEIQIRATAEGAYRYDYQTPAFGRLTQAFDGRFTWQRNEVLGYGQLTAPEHANNLASADFRVALKIGQKFPGRRRLPDQTIDGKARQVVELTEPNNIKSRWFFDPDTGLRVRIESDDPAGLVVLEFRDFRDAGGLKEPFRVRRTLAGQVLDIAVQSLLYNEETDPELFAAPIGLVENNARIERLLQAHLVTMGFGALQQIRTRRTKAALEITTSGLKMRTVMFQKQPNLMVTQTEAPGMGAEWKGYDGKIGWVWSELQGYRTMEGAELAQTMGNADLLGPLRLGALCPFRKLLDERSDDGRRIIGITFSSMQGPAGNFYFDTKTSELVRVETFLQAGASGQLKVVADFSDFRRVDGVLIPFRTVLTNPAMRMVSVVESVEHNVPLDDQLFVPRKE